MPNKNNNRLGRIDEEFKKEMSSIISYDLKEPKVTGLVSVTRVKVTPDLKYAKVWVSILNAKNTEETLEGLKKSAGFIRAELAKRINLRYTPELSFVIDDVLTLFVKITPNVTQIIVNNLNFRITVFVNFLQI